VTAAERATAPPQLPHPIRRQLGPAGASAPDAQRAGPTLEDVVDRTTAGSLPDLVERVLRHVVDVVE
jgi:hypothetical protein